MKTFIISLLLFSASISASSKKYISIEHCGESDKPIFTIFISFEEINVNRHDLFFLVESKCYKKINNTISNFYLKTALQTDHKFGNFAVTISSKNKENIIFQMGRKNANIFFPELISGIKETCKNKDLIEQLEYTYERIKL